MLGQPPLGRAGIVFRPLQGLVGAVVNIQAGAGGLDLRLGLGGLAAGAAAGWTGVSVGAAHAATSGTFSGMDKRAISHDHGPASCEVAGRPALGRFRSWE